MADATAIADLRRLINEPDNTDPWTDEVLGARIDAWTGPTTSLAATIWREKAASYSELVDIQEGSSNRKLSQMYAQALKMADGLDGGTSAVVSSARRSRTRMIERM